MPGIVIVAAYKSTASAGLKQLSAIMTRNNERPAILRERTTYVVQYGLLQPSDEYVISCAHLSRKAVKRTSCFREAGISNTKLLRNIAVYPDTSNANARARSGSVRKAIDDVRSAACWSCPVSLNRHIAEGSRYRPVQRCGRSRVPKRWLDRPHFDKEREYRS